MASLVLPAYIFTILIVSDVHYCKSQQPHITTIHSCIWTATAWSHFHTLFPSKRMCTKIKLFTTYSTVSIINNLVFQDQNWTFISTNIASLCTAFWRNDQILEQLQSAILLHLIHSTTQFQHNTLSSLWEQIHDQSFHWHSRSHNTSCLPWRC